MLLADAKPPLASPYSSGPSEHDFYSATLRMAKVYYERFPEVLDWANGNGRTAAHAAALRGNEELLRVCRRYIFRFFSFQSELVLCRSCAILEPTST